MMLPWKEFQICLRSFSEFLAINVTNADGIVGTEENLTIVQKAPLTQAEIDTISGYYNSLTAEGENLKITRPIRLSISIKQMKEDILQKDITTLNTIEYKLLLNLPLTVAEENQILGES